MTGIGVVPTGFYGITDMASEDAIRTVTQLVYDHVPTGDVETVLLALGLCELIGTTEPVHADITLGGRLCEAGRHENIPANRYWPKDRPVTRCRLCKREHDRAHRSQSKLKSKQVGP